MRRSFCLIPIILLTVLLSACGAMTPDGSRYRLRSGKAVPETESPEHAEGYLEGVETEEVLTAFFEVVLHAEYVSGNGNDALVQKWGEPLLYYIHGDATEEDLKILRAFFRQLNRIPGFPGIEKVRSSEEANLDIGFYEEREFNSIFGDAIDHEEADGAMQYWYYSNSNMICRGRVGYRTDASQSTRNSVLLEEIVNVLGFGDTLTRKDSIVYQYGSSTEELSDMDWLLIRLLYDERMQPGLDAESCEALLRKLYY